MRGTLSTTLYLTVRQIQTNDGQLKRQASEDRMGVEGKKQDDLLDRLLDRLLDPAHTAVVTCECQQGVLGEEAVFPALAEAASKTGLLENVRLLCTAARRARVPVVHCTAERRTDGRGANTNARLFAAAARTPFDPALHPGLGADPERDLVLPRLHGLGPFQDTGLASVLRNLGATTVVVTGVSVNVALLELTLGAVDAGLQAVIPTDAVAGTPPEYAEAVLAHTLALVATLTDTATVAAALARRNS
jgi:nicotinamidase-related amidase